jgi:CHAD domain-containing protein
VREIELKLAVHGSFVMPALADEDLGVATMEQLPDLDMKTTYYDGPDLRLARYGITLRNRSGEPGGPRWTLKLPVPGEDATAHEEHHFSGASTKVPGPARDLVTAYLRSASLAAAASVRTRRHRWALRDSDGSDLCEVVDDEVSVVEGSKIVSRFRELEVEASAFDRSQLESVAEALRQAGAMAAEPIPKAVRAMGARATAPPDVPSDHAVGPDDPAGEAVRAALIRGLNRLISHDPGVRLGNDIEDVHQMRVATRRLRSDLRTFASLVDPEWAEALIGDVKWLGRALGAVRDVEVQQERFGESAADLGADLRPLVERIERDHKRTRTSLLREMRGEQYLRVLDDLVRAQAAPRFSERAGKTCGEVLPALVAAAWARLAKRGRKLRPGDPDGDYHRVRILAKRARYAAEAVAPALGSRGDDALDFAKKCAKLQDALGGLQDAAMASDTIEAIAKDHPDDGALNLALGRLLERERRAGLAGRAAYEGLWDSLDRKKNVKWFGA